MVASYRLMIIHHRIGAKHRSNRIRHTKIITTNSARKDLAVHTTIREILMEIDARVEIPTITGSEAIRAITEETIGKIAMTTER